MTPEETDLAVRCWSAASVLTADAREAQAAGSEDRARHLHSKAQGVRLVLSYLEEGARRRLDGPELTPAPLPPQGTTREGLMTDETTAGWQLGTNVLNSSDREVALDYAVRFHHTAKSMDPATVVETAKEFLAFLVPPDGAVG